MTVQCAFFYNIIKVNKMKKLLILFVGILCAFTVASGLIACNVNGGNEGDNKDPGSQLVETTGVTLNASDIELQIGEKLTLTATVQPENATDKKVAWQSSDPAVATVVNGQVTAIAKGQTEITAVCGGKSAKCTVKVSEKPVDDKEYGVKLDKTSVTMFVGDSERLVATVNLDGGADKTVSWMSLNDEVATVENGVVSALKVGITVITAVCGDYSASCTVSIAPVKATGITLNEQNITVYIGDSYTLKATVSPENASENTVAWMSYDDSVATVIDGKIYGRNEGSTVVVAMCETHTATCVVNVVDGAVKNLTFDKSELSMFIGENYSLTAKVEPEYAKDKTVIWKSSDENIATVADGKITALQEGEVTIIGSAGGIEAECTVRIADPDPVTGIEVTGGGNAFIDAVSLSDYNIKLTRKSGNTEYLDLKEEYLSFEDLAKLSVPGEHSLTVNYKKLSCTWNLNVINHEFDGVELRSQTFICDGEVKSLEVTGAPDGTSITYTNNGQIEHGEYTVTAVLEKEYYNSKTLTATLTINYSTFDGAELNSRTFMYDGEAKSLEVTGAPEGTRIEYTGNGRSEAGEYTVTATLTKRYYVTKTLTATMKIEVIERNITYVLGYEDAVNANPEKFNVAFGLELIAPERGNAGDGLYFTGWYSDANYLNIVTRIEAGTDVDIILYAKWELPYNVDEDGTLTSVKPFGKDLTEITVLPEANGVKIRKIGDSAFKDCKKLVSVTLPEGVIYIGNSVFAGLDNLTTVNLPGSIETIGRIAFQYCYGLKSITIPDGVKTIGVLTFSNCTNLTDIKLPANLEKIEMKAFSDCSKLASIDLPETLTDIEVDAFSASGLRTIIIPGKVKHISAFTFMYCRDLMDVIIPESVTSIGKAAFVRCSSLKNLNIPQNVTSIGEEIFTGCNSLTLTVSENNPVYYVDGNCLIERTTKCLKAGFLNSVIPSDGSVTAISAYAFSSINITGITIPSSVVKIGACAFEFCDSLNSVIFENTAWNYYVPETDEEIIIPPASLQDPSQAANLLTNDKANNEWRARAESN